MFSWDFQVLKWPVFVNSVKYSDTALKTYIVDLVEGAVGKDYKHKCFGISVRQFGHVCCWKWSRRIEVDFGDIAVDINESDDNNENEYQKLERPENVIDNDAPSSGDGV